jgi:hypothetical protein
MIRGADSNTETVPFTKDGGEAEQVSKTWFDQGIAATEMASRSIQ